MRWSPGSGSATLADVPLSVRVRNVRRGAKTIQKEEPIELRGVVTEALGNSNFRVEINENHTVLAKIAGRMRRYRIRVLPGDSVTVEVSPYDLERGRITYRHKG